MEDIILKMDVPVVLRNSGILGKAIHGHMVGKYIRGMHNTMSNYLEVTDPKAFLDIERRKADDYPYGEPVECPVCKGYGKWNLRIDAYGPGKHFRAGCGQCNGWGYVTKGSADESCKHEYKEMPSKRMFEHNYKCTRCGALKTTDSS